MSASRLSLRSSPARSSRANVTRASLLALGLGVVGCGSGSDWTEYNLQALTGDAQAPNDRADAPVAQEAAVDSGPTTDVVDAAMPVDSGIDTGPMVVDVADAGFPDVVMVDTGTDTGPIGVDAVDAGFPDRGVVDSGTDTGVDTGTPDAGTPDTGPADAGMCRITTVAINGGRVLNLGSTGPIEVRFGSTGNCVDRLHDTGAASNRTIDAANFAGGGNDYPVSAFTISAPDGMGTMRTNLNMYGLLSGLSNPAGVGVNLSFNLNGQDVRGATRVYFARPTLTFNPRTISTTGNYALTISSATPDQSCTTYFFNSGTADNLVFNHGSEAPCTTLGAPCGEGETCGYSRVRPLPVAGLACVNSDLVATASTPIVIAPGTTVPFGSATTSAIRSAIPSGSGQNVRVRMICAQNASGNTVVTENLLSR